MRSSLKRRLVVYGAVAAVAALALGLLYGAHRRDRKNLDALAARAAKRHGLDPSLVEAVVEVESRFRPQARSRAGAIGLMQLRPATASEVAGKELTEGDLYDPARNLDLGCAYLARLLRRYHGNRTAALMAYNAGPGKTDAWLAKDPNPERALETLAYRETRDYVRKVMEKSRQFSVDSRR